MSSTRPLSTGAAPGFTLVDTLIATLLLSAGVAGLLAVQLVQVGAGLRSRQLTEATALAQQQLELLRVRPAATEEVLGPPQPLDARGCPVPGVTPPCDQAIAGTVYTRSFRVTPLAAGYAQLQVSVSWVDPQGQPHTVSLNDAR